LVRFEELEQLGHGEQVHQPLHQELPKANVEERTQHVRLAFGNQSKKCPYRVNIPFVVLTKLSV
jgi:hypothetical protein